MDIFTKETRSKIMASIKNTSSKTEVKFRKLLHKNGYRYRINVRALPGIPDIYLPKYRTVIFIHGCFWHQHRGCKHGRVPKSNVKFWKPKLERNVERDKEVMDKYWNTDIQVITIWECEIKTNSMLEKKAMHVITQLKESYTG